MAALDSRCKAAIALHALPQAQPLPGQPVPPGESASLSEQEDVRNSPGEGAGGIGWGSGGDERAGEGGEACRVVRLGGSHRLLLSRSAGARLLRRRSLHLLLLRKLLRKLLRLQLHLQPHAKLSYHLFARQPAYRRG